MVNIGRCGLNDFGLFVLWTFLDKKQVEDGCISPKEMKKGIKKITKKCTPSAVNS